MQLQQAHTGYNLLATPPNTVFVTLRRADFFNISNNLPTPQPLANPDGFEINAPSSLGGAAGFQTGYTGAAIAYPPGLDIGPAMVAAGMQWVSSVYIDNSEGAGTLILRHPASGLQVTARPFTQGYYPFVVPQSQSMQFAVGYVDPLGNNSATKPSFGTYPDNAAGTGVGGQFYSRVVESGAIFLQFSDLIVPPCVWETRNWATMAAYSFAPTIAVGNTFQTLLAKNPFRKGFTIMNPSTAGEPVFWNMHQDGETDTIANSLILAPGERFAMFGPPAYVGSITGTAATAAHAVLIKEFQ